MPSQRPNNTLVNVLTKFTAFKFIYLQPKIGWASCLLAFMTVFGFWVSSFNTPHPAAAQSPLFNSRSYITPFPEGDRYQLYVIGDGLADGLFAGMAAAFANNRMIATYKQTKWGSGFTRIRGFDWNRVLDNLLNVNKVHIAVVMIGSNDNKPIWYKRRKYEFMSPEWKKIYRQRVNKFMRRLKRAKTAVYWVGMPIMQQGPYNAQMQSINDLFLELAFNNGIRFINTGRGFTDQFGNYIVYGADLTGRMRRLRHKDGIHFTPHGYRKLAHFIAQEIRKDLKSAREEREIPLAGSEEEQRRLFGGPAQETGRATPQTTTPSRNTAHNKATQNRKRHLKAAHESKQRQADSASTRLAPIKNPLHGETIANEMSIGLTALASVSSLNDTSTKEDHLNLPLEQRPYYKVFEKGQAMRPKRNRSDDFTWPPVGG